MSKLNQVIAVSNGKKSQVNSEVTNLYKKVQKQDLFNGISRTYHPLDDEGETFPPEKKNVQYTADSAIHDVSGFLSSLYDIVATQDVANTKALANVVVDEQVVLSDVPVTYLLFLEKQLNDLHTFINALPVLDPADNWQWSDTANCYVSDVVYTNKTKKVLRNHVKYEATDKHPAQVETYSEDVKVGEWATTKFSGALSSADKGLILSRIDRLQDAVKYAREQANMSEVEQVNVSRPLFTYLFGKD